jgi:hypothetical protein
MENGLHIKYHPLVPIEKSFSKTHAHVFELVLKCNLSAIDK